MIARASLRHFTRHPWQLALLMLGIMLGVAVVTAVDVTADSARHSFRQAQLQLSGSTTHRVLADQPVPETLYTQLRRDPRDWRSAPVITAPLKDNLGQQLLMQLIGVDPLREQGFRQQLNRLMTPRVTPFALQDNPAALLAESTAKALGIAVNDMLPLQTPAGPRQVRVLGLLDDSDDPRLQQLLIMDIGQAQSLLNMTGRLSHVDMILTEQEASAVAELLPAGIRLEATATARAEQNQLAKALYFNLQAMALLAMVVGLFLVYSSVWFSLSQRRPVFSRLRAIGMQSSELYRYLVLELLLIALISTLAGVGLGVMLAQFLLSLMLQTLSDLYASTSLELLLLQPATLAKLVLVGVGGSYLAAWIPGREVATVSPLLLQQRYLQEQRSARTDEFLFLRAGAGLLLAVLLLFWAGSGLWGAFIAVAALLLAFALAMPIWLRLLSAALDTLLRYYGWSLRIPVLSMIIRDTVRHQSRTGITAMALMIAISATVGISGMVGSFRDAVSLWLQERLIADLYITQAQVLPGIRTPLPDAFISGLSALDGVETAATLKRTQLSVGQRPVYIYGSELPLQMRAAYRFVDSDAQLAWHKLEQGNSILISEPLANRMRLVAGSSAVLSGSRGEQAFTVAGIYYDYGSDSGRILTLNKTFDRYWPDREPYAVALFLKEGVPFEGIEQQIRARWSQQAALSIQRASTLLARSLEVFNRTFIITDVLRLLALLVAFIGVLSSLLAIQLERQQEVSLLKALGFSRTELLLLLLGQALILGVAAGLMAIVAGEALSWSLTSVVQLRAFGWSIPYAASPIGWLTALAVSVGAALLASIYPAWRFSRQQGVRHWE
ncbi:FtsX-like permease family protein [Amphritea sp. HPY]|uniref:ABC transporter permease n=1 Tax=Amphritea sp. HPY TaxID=3421652 RepID=UPI003D7D84DF